MAPYTDQDLTSAEEERIKALRRYDVPDTLPDESLDKLTKLATHLFKVPIAMISMVDREGIWFKSKYGTDMQQLKRDDGLCAAVIKTGDFYLVENAATDPRTMAHPLVSGEFGLKFYAAYPLITIEGHHLGAFCIMDKMPRKLNIEETVLLKDLRDIAMDHMELKLASRTLASRHNQILNTTAHDLRNPLTTIPVRADLIKLKKHDPETVDVMCDQIKMASLSMVGIIDELLQSGSMEAGQIQLLVMRVSISSLVANIVAMNQPLAERKGQCINFSAQTEAIINGDEGKLSEIVDNLINNAIKYAPVDTNIDVRVTSSEAQVIIEVEDEGPGLTAEDKKHLFQRFTRLSAQPTGGEHSTGLGLSIVKVLVQAHGGQIHAESEGAGRGAKFVVRLPLSK